MGRSVLDLRIREVTNAVHTAAGDQCLQTARDIHADIQASFREGKSGRIYDGHQASAPGQAPAMQTGTYAASWLAERIDAMSAFVGTDSPLGPILELGTRRMSPRPHFIKAVEKASKDFSKNMDQRLGEAASRAGIR